MHDWMGKTCLTAVLLIASSCIVYQSPRCLFDKGDGLAILSVYFQPNNSTQLGISYWKDGFGASDRLIAAL